MVCAARPDWSIRSVLLIFLPPLPSQMIVRFQSESILGRPRQSTWIGAAGLNVAPAGRQLPVTAFALTIVLPLAVTLMTALWPYARSNVLLAPDPAPTLVVLMTLPSFLTTNVV